MANFENSGSQPLAKASVKGTVKWFNSTKGYGFITLEDGSDAFCHASALASQGTPNVPQGATVVCDLQDSPRGLQVVAVHSIDTSTADPTPSRGPRPGGDRFGGNRSGGGERHGGGDRFGGGERYGGDDRFSDRFGGGDRFSSNADRFGGGDRFGGDRPRAAGGAPDAGPSGPMVDGRVKFFNDQKGFGFVMPDNGGGDVYCHASALRRSGLSALSPEQRIRFSTRQGTKGVEVDRIELI
jgi:CspA family cold shock protein